VPRLPPPPRARRVAAWRAVLAAVAIALLGVAAATRSWSLVALAAAPGLAALLLDPRSLHGRGGI